MLGVTSYESYPYIIQSTFPYIHPPPPTHGYNPTFLTSRIWVRASIGFQGETSANYTLGRILPPGDGDATCLTVLPGYQSALARTVLVVGYADNKVRLWEVATGALLDTWTVHTQPIYSLATMKVRGIFNAASQQLSPPIVEAHRLPLEIRGACFLMRAGEVALDGR